MTWTYGWVGFWGRLRVAVLRHSAAFSGTAISTARSKGTSMLGSQYVTAGLGWPGL